jgi:hypothetical protein
MSENKPEAKACPFCEVQPFIYSTGRMVECETEACDMQGRAIAIEVWNSRPIEDKLREDQKRIASALNLEPEMGEGWCSVESILKRIGEWDGDRTKAWADNASLRIQLADAIKREELANDTAKRLGDAFSAASDDRDQLAKRVEELKQEIQRQSFAQVAWAEDLTTACREVKRLKSDNTRLLAENNAMRETLEKIQVNAFSALQGDTMNPDRFILLIYNQATAALSAPDSQPTPTKPNEKYFPREDIADLRELVTALDEAQNTEELNAAVVAIREILEHPAVEPPTSPRTRCSCSFAHPPHDFCDGNPGAKFVAALPPAANPASETDKGEEEAPTCPACNTVFTPAGCGGWRCLKCESNAEANKPPGPPSPPRLPCRQCGHPFATHREIRGRLLGCCGVNGCECHNYSTGMVG